MNVLVHLRVAILTDVNALDDATITTKREGAALLAKIEPIRELKDEL